MADGRRVQLGATIRWADALDEVVVLDADTGASWLLDPAGAVIWKALLAAGTAAGAVKALGGSAEADAEVTAFLATLVERGTLVVAG